MTTASDPVAPSRPAEEAASATMRVVGMPGPFAAWGLSWVCQILEHAGHAPDVVPLAEAAPGFRLGFGHAALPLPPGGRSVVFLDTPAAAVGALLPQRRDPMDVARELTQVLAPLPALLQEGGALLVRREASPDLAATRRAIARLLLPALPPPDVAMPCEAAFGQIPPEPTLSGQALTLTRQVLDPMFALVLGDRQHPVVWPLSCFYAGDQPGEQAAPIVDTEGPARILYYGPYFHLPPGRWRVEIQMFFSNDVPASMFAAEMIAGGATLARIEFRPEYGGLFQAVMPLVLDATAGQIEFRIWMLSGTISGQFGLRQVRLMKLDDESAALSA